MAPQQQEELDKKVESTESSTSSVSDKTSREAESGKQDLVESAKKVIEALKAGGKSGITSDFGKPFLIEDGQQLTKDTAPKTYTSGELPSIKGKITGEMKKPGMEGGIGEGAQKIGEKIVAWGEHGAEKVLGVAGDAARWVGEKIGGVLGEQGGIGGAMGEGGLSGVINEAGAVKMPGGEIQPGVGDVGPVKMPGGEIQPMPGEIGPVKMPGGERPSDQLPPSVEFPQPGNKNPGDAPGEIPTKPGEKPEQPPSVEFPQKPGDIPGIDPESIKRIEEALKKILDQMNDPGFKAVMEQANSAAHKTIQDIADGKEPGAKTQDEKIKELQGQRDEFFNMLKNGDVGEAVKQLQKIAEDTIKSLTGEGGAGDAKAPSAPELPAEQKEKIAELQKNREELFKQLKNIMEAHQGTAQDVINNMAGAGDAPAPTGAQRDVKIPTGEYQRDAQPKPSIPQGEMQPGGSLPETYDTSARKDDATTKGGDSAVDAKEKGSEKQEKKADKVIEMEPMKIVGHYNGEEIHKDCDPTTHTVEKGDTLSKIAKEHLGPDATKEEIAKHVKEIARLSGIENPDKIKPGQELIIPGHTKDGGMVLEDNAGSKYTRWQDGTLRVENADQSGYVQKPTADGGYTEHHWGKHEDQNYELTKTGDGKYLVADSPCDVPEVADAGDPRVARAKLEETISEKITDPVELAQFREDMRRFEDRAREQHMSPEQVAKTYENLNRLISHEGDQPIPHDQKVHIAEDVINQAADPKTIDQGYHETCNVTTVESRAYTRDPAEASRIVADLATTGQVTYKDGTTVTMPANSMAPDGEASNHPAGYGDRSHASQLFQVAAVNSYYQTHPYTYTDAAGVVHNVPAGGMRYEQQAPIPGQNPQDTGERLVDTTNLDAKGNPIPALDSSGNEVHSPDLTDQGIQEVNNRVTGEKGPDTYICHDDYVYGPKKGMDLVKSENELNEHIAKLAKEGKLPVIIGVHSGNEPFLHDSGGGAAGGSGGGHVVTVTGYDPGPPAKVEIDNQWGEGNDHQGDSAVSVHDLYHAMRPPTNEKQLAEIQAEVVENRKPGGKEPDTFQEFEVLRLENKMPSTSANKISDAQFDKQMGEQMEAAAKRWKEHENPEDKAKAQEKLNDIISSLPPERRLKMLEKAHDTGMFDDKQYDEMMTDSIKAIRARYKREDTAGTGNAAERQKTRDQLKHMLDALPEDRRQDIIDNATK